ncbi:MAG: hypothetical protein E7190_00515 [Erysipelotrichaceae bacterium]|nr:hypothetical protein [Erysipelotrichaceae bacterium]
MTRLIDADALLMAIIGYPYGYRGMIESEIENQPTVDAEPVRHGKWIYGNEFHWYVASCNKCGYQRRTDIKADGWNQWNYCPNCGCRMDAE